MDCFQIEGPVSLSGSVAAAGSKNAALPILAASLLAQGPVELHRIPRLDDVRVMLRVLAGLGAEIHGLDDGGVGIVAPDDGPFIVPTRLARAMRASFCVLGPLLARRGRAVVPLPGGCRIGPRPIDLHLAGLAALGADLSIDGDRVVGRARPLARRHGPSGRPARLDRHRHRQRPVGRRAGPGQNGHLGGCPRTRDCRPGPLSCNRSALGSKDLVPA